VEPRPEPSAEKKPLPLLREACAHVEEFRGDPSVRPRRLSPRQRGRRGLAARPSGAETRVGEGKLILLRLAGFRNSLLARELVSEFAEAGGVAGAREAFCAVAGANRSAGKRALRWPVTAALSAGLRPGLFRML